MPIQNELDLPTRERVRLLLAANPVRTLQEIADIVGVSHQRVNQICAKYGYLRIQPIKPVKYTICKCGKQLNQNNVTGFCQPCWVESNRKTYICECGCGREFTRYGLSADRNAHHFLNRSHFGHWITTQRGFGLRNPETYKKALETRRKRTHCKRGHPFDDENTYYYYKQGKLIGRYCRACWRIRDAMRRR